MWLTLPYDGKRWFNPAQIVMMQPCEHYTCADGVGENGTCIWTSNASTNYIVVQESIGEILAYIAAH